MLVWGKQPLKQHLILLHQSARPDTEFVLVCHKYLIYQNSLYLLRSNFILSEGYL